MKIWGPGWEEVKPLGSGGQGKVFLVRSPESVKERNENLRALEENFRVLAHAFTGEKAKHAAVDLTFGTPAHLEYVGDSVKEAKQAAEGLASAISAYTSQEDPAQFGALKKFEITGDGPEARKAMSRLESEVKALSEISHPSILKLLYPDVQSRLMITEYQPNGTLAANRSRFTGNVRESLEAFYPLVEAVDVLHRRGPGEPKIIHRDIKPENIFVGSDGRLILGDFGIVFFQDEDRKRITSTYGEKAGTADWMAPWANVRERLDEVNPTFDIFPLGKVLWWMISGKPSLPFWYHRRPTYDLEKLYRHDPHMSLVNRILDRCVVEEEKDCLSDSQDLLDKVGEALHIVKRGGQLWKDSVYRPCRICATGEYKREDPQADIYHMGSAHMSDVFRCGSCGHIQLFTTRGIRRERE